ncbi:MAG: glycosyltransferase family 2 protein [Candidatus Dormibacteria bacterium]
MVTTVPDATAPDAVQPLLISVIVVTYETTPTMLSDCLGAVLASDYKPIELILVDNSQTSVVAEHIADWKVKAADVGSRLVFLPQDRNLGYAAATNQAVEVSTGELLLLLNPDALVDGYTISALVDAAARRPQALGFAPKVSLQGHEWILDSVGIDLLLRAEGSQRGLGEPDIGQFDLEERVAGLCFAAALVRRAAFKPESVGSLDERFFMFYEDVDWSMRAVLRGGEFWSVPTAHVRHVHSASTRAMPTRFKDRLIRRNLVWTATKNLERRRVVGVVASQTLRSMGRGILAGHAWTALRDAGETWIGVPAMLASRREYQRRRTRPDGQALAKTRQPASFDAATYQPMPTVATLVSVLARLYVTAPDPRLGDLIMQLTLAGKMSVGYPGRMAQLVRESGVEIRPGLEWLLQQLESD